MPRCFVDHIAVTAPSLEDGAAYVREVLGVSPQAGGEHPRMGTHNLLLRLVAHVDTPRGVRQLEMGVGLA